MSQLIRFCQSSLFLQADWDTVAKEAGYQDGTNAKIMYRRLLTSLKKSKAGALTASPRKVKRGKKANKDENGDDSSVKKGKYFSFTLCLPYSSQQKKRSAPQSQ